MRPSLCLSGYNLRRDLLPGRDGNTLLARWGLWKVLELRDGCPRAPCHYPSYEVSRTGLDNNELLFEVAHLHGVAVFHQPRRLCPRALHSAIQGAGYGLVRAAGDMREELMRLLEAALGHFQ